MSARKCMVGAACAVVAGLALLSGQRAQAAVIDTMADASHFAAFGPPSPSTVQWNAGTPNTVSIIRSGSNTDAGAMWGDTGVAKIPLTADNDVVTVQPAAYSSSDASYSIAFTLFKPDGSYLKDVNWAAVQYSKSLSQQVMPDLMSYLQSNGTDPSTVGSYQLKIRVFPWVLPAGEASSSVSFSGISATAVPEPGMIGLLAMGGVALIGRKRRA